MKILITGANGFVGQALGVSAQFQQAQLFGMVRSIDHTLNGPVQPVVYDSLNALAQDCAFLSTIDCIVHLAARVHVMADTERDPLAAFRAVNTVATRELAIAAAQAGVQRFVYLSSIKVNGEGEVSAYCETSVPQPSDPYGISKWEAECALAQVAADTGLEVVIIRPPLVYGPQVKANFLQLMHLIRRGIPLPLGGVRNARSLVFIGNLVDALWQCAIHPAAVGQTFLVSDGLDISTPELISQLAAGMQHRARLLPIPAQGLRIAGKLLGKSAQIDRLLGSLRVDSDKLRQTLGWTPPFSLASGLANTAQWYLQTL